MASFGLNRSTVATSHHRALCTLTELILLKHGCRSFSLMSEWMFWFELTQQSTDGDLMPQYLWIVFTACLQLAAVGFNDYSYLCLFRVSMATRWVGNEGSDHECIQAWNRLTYKMAQRWPRAAFSSVCVVMRQATASDYWVYRMSYIMPISSEAFVTFTIPT